MVRTRFMSFLMRMSRDLLFLTLLYHTRESAFLPIVTFNISPSRPDSAVVRGLGSGAERTEDTQDSGGKLRNIRGFIFYFTRLFILL